MIIESSESSCGEDDGCCRCYENKAADVVLLCDGCDAAYHTLCLRPPVIDIPDEDWFCPYCHQVSFLLWIYHVSVPKLVPVSGKSSFYRDFGGKMVPFWSLLLIPCLF